MKNGMVRGERGCVGAGLDRNRYVVVLEFKVGCKVMVCGYLFGRSGEKSKS